MMRPLIASILLLTLCIRVADAPRVLFTARFDRPEVMSDWNANADIVSPRIADGALQFRCAGPDPILVYRPLLNIAASPYQAIEIRMKADHDGGFEVFWSGTTQGRYGGFSGEKRTPFTVRGDGQWRTYRLFPFWHKEGRIVRLRLDPYDGTQFAIAWVRIMEYETPQSSGAPAFDFGRDGAGWQALHGVTLRHESSGLTLSLDASDGFALGPPMHADARRFPIVALRLSSSARRAALVFATDDSYGLHVLPFALLPDGREHVYNLDMLNAPEWQGCIVAVGLRPGEQAGDACRLHWLRFAERPQGPPEVRALWFGVEDALPRAGVPVMLRARLTNVGGESAKRLQASLSLPAGAKMLRTVDRGTDELRFGQETEYAWQALFPRPMAAKITLRVEAANIAPLTVKATDQITGRLPVPKSAAVPEPRPMRGRYQVGVYYFPGWKSASQWAPIKRFPERKPALGWYREGEPEVIDWQIKWAAEHGITFFAYDWYWTQGARQLEHGLDAFLRSRYRKWMQFCLLWANHNPPKTSSREDLLAVTRYWIDTYFRQPEYLRVDDKPVVVIFSPYRLREDMGSAAVRAGFEAMRDVCRAQGLKGLYLIACIGNTGEAELAAQEGYDAITAYNWPGLGVQGNETRAPYDTLIEGYRRQWEHLVERSSLPLLPPISGGWDSRPWHGDAALVRAGRDPEKFRRHLQDAVRFLDSHPKFTLPMALIEAWNEWGEGSYIEPHKEFGFGYLDAIRDVFTTAPKAHQDITPADVGLPPRQVTFTSPTLTRWEFKEGLQGWDSGMNISEAKIAEGALTVRTTGDDPALFGPPVQITAEGYRTVYIRLRLQSADGAPFIDTAQLFWGTRSAAICEASSVKFPVNGDGEWHDYVVSLADNPRWRGLVTNLRFDPCARTGVLVQCEAIELRR